MNKKQIATIAFIAASLTLRSYGWINTIEGLGSSWDGNPSVTTGGSPTDFTIAEENYGSTAPYTLSQSFWVGTRSILNDIQVYAGGSFSSNSVHLYDLGTGANPAAYSPGVGSTSADLLQSGSFHNLLTFGGPDPSVLEFQFFGADAVTLAAGHRYAFEIEPMVGPYIGQITWYRSLDNVYMNGAAYRQRSILGGAPGADMSFAVNLTPVPEPCSLTLAALGAVLARSVIRRKYRK